MEELTKKVSKNSFDLIQIGAQRMKGKWLKALLGALCYIAPLALICLIPYAGWAIDLVLYGYLTMGIIKFYKDLLNGKDAKVIDIFTQTQNFAVSIFLGLVLVLLTFVGTVLVIIPGLFVIGYFSMSFYVFNEEKNGSVSEVLNSCANKMKGHKTTLLSYKIIFYLFYVVLIGAMVLISLLLAKLYCTSVVGATLLFILAYAIFIFLLSLNTIYFQATNQVFYEEIINNQKNKGEKIENKVEEKTVANLDSENQVETKNDVEKPKTSKNAESSDANAKTAKTTTTKTKPKQNAKTTAAKPNTKTASATPKKTNNKK